jgi:hypothetical protein
MSLGVGMSKHRYSIGITENGKLSQARVLGKMTELRDAHMESGARLDTANNIAFEYGRELFGFNLAEKWINEVPKYVEGVL